MAKTRWFRNSSGGMSTTVRPSIALSPAEYRWLGKLSKTGEYGEKSSINDVLYHLTKKAIDSAMQQQGEWCE